MHTLAKIRALGVVVMWICIGCGGGGEGSTAAPAEKIPLDSHQVVVVTSDLANPFRGTVTCWSYVDKKWGVAIPPMDAVIGREGFVPASEKKEGDGKTPTGVYRLARAFGYAEKIHTGLQYRQVTKDDFWVDDPASKQYNQWVVGKPEAKSFEKLKREDDLYAVGVVIEYNTDPVQEGKGSAIFLHCWKNNESPTAGCVALAEKDLRQILQWLDQRHGPVISIGRY